MMVKVSIYLNRRVFIMTSSLFVLSCHYLFLISLSFGASGRAVLRDCGISWVSLLIFQT